MFLTRCANVCSGDGNGSKTSTSSCGFLLQREVRPLHLILAREGYYYYTRWISSAPMLTHCMSCAQWGRICTVPQLTFTMLQSLWSCQDIAAHQKEDTEPHWPPSAPSLHFSFTAEVITQLTDPFAFRRSMFKVSVKKSTMIYLFIYLSPFTIYHLPWKFSQNSCIYLTYPSGKRPNPPFCYIKFD